MRTYADKNTLALAVYSEGVRRAVRHAVLIIVVFVACLCLVTMAAGQTVDEPSDARVREAIVEAVRARMGADVEVTVKDLRVRLAGELPAQLSAMPDAGAQTGGPVRFMLFDAADVADTNPAETGVVSRAASAQRVNAAAHARRVGSVDLKLFVSGPRVVARAVIARGAQVDAADIDALAGDMGRQPIKPLEPAARIVGARAVRTIAAGELITPRLLALAPLVQSGDEVRTRVRIGELEAHGQAVAAQNGALGQEIILIAESKRRLRGRVIGEREVEVLHEE